MLIKENKKYIKAQLKNKTYKTSKKLLRNLLDVKNVNMLIPKSAI